jgi:hypothetical protein
MLRGLVVLFLAINAALFFWIRSDPKWGQSDREPQRLQHQVSPDSIQVLPDLPTRTPAKAGSAPGVATATEATLSLPPAAGLPEAHASAAAPAAPGAWRPGGSVVVTARPLRRTNAALSARGGTR